MRVMKGVYCEGAFDGEVNAVLETMRIVLAKAYPEWKFDTDGPDWEECEEDDEEDEG